MKIGLDYFPLDTDLFGDIKIRKLIRRQGGKAVTVYTLLLCIIYRRGYYMRWDEDLPFIISEQTGFDEAYIREVVRCCMTVGLFDKSLFDAERVLSSRGIQVRYKLVNKLTKRNAKVTAFSLISSEEKGITSEEKGITSEEKGITSEEKGITSEEEGITSEEEGITSEEEGQSKVKEKKEKKKKENAPSPSPPRGAPRGSSEGALEGEIDFDIFLRHFNALLKEYDSKISPLRRMTDERRGRLNGLLASGYTKSDIERVLRNAVSSAMLNGRVKKGFVPGFDWLMEERNFVRVLEGEFNYK